MNAVLVLLIGCAILIAGYVFYGSWLAKQWGTTGSADIKSPACDTIGNDQSAIVYDLQGRRVSDTSKPGVYVYKNRILLK